MNSHTCTDLHDGVRNRREKSSSGRFFGTPRRSTRRFFNTHGPK
nr:unnamed protein product [Callosobruchus chinensis]